MDGGRARLVLAAMALADATTSGATAWSADGTLTESIARRLHAGTMFRNAYGLGALDPRLPFGGWKESGIGSEYGAEGLRVYSRLQALPPLRPFPGAAG